MMRTLLGLVVVTGCGGAKSALLELPVALSQEPVEATPIVTPIVTPIAPPKVVPAITRIYGPEIHSVRFEATTMLRKDPNKDADKVGVIQNGIHVGVQRTAEPNAGCKSRWIQIVPRGWTCETAVVPSRDEPTTAIERSLDDADDTEQPVVRGIYGVVRGDNAQAFGSVADAQAGIGRALSGSNTVRVVGVVKVDGRRYWRTSAGDLVDESSISTISPSKFKGVAIDPGGTLPAWVHARGDYRKPITTYSIDDKVLGSLAARTVVTILESREARVRVSETEWVARADLRIAALAAPPVTTKPDEKWFDVDLDQQVLVAYEGARPVYATLVSTGKYGHYTPTLVTRIIAKHETANMTSDKKDVYSVADVPWTMYYDGNYALHTSYWHDGFGGPRSHGCVNLAPRDARALYHWSSPDVPPGWSTVYGDPDNPGSLVRIRSSLMPEPGLRGYARTMQDGIASESRVELTEAVASAHK